MTTKKLATIKKKLQTAIEAGLAQGLYLRTAAQTMWPSSLASCPYFANDGGRCVLSVLLSKSPTKNPVSAQHMVRLAAANKLGIDFRSIRALESGFEGWDAVILSENEGQLLLLGAELRQLYTETENLEADLPSMSLTPGFQALADNAAF